MELHVTKSPLFPGAGEGAMVTSDWCISADCILVALTPISWSQHFYKCLFSVWTLYVIIRKVFIFVYFVFSDSK